MTSFTVNSKDYSHKELNTMYDFFTGEQWETIVSALDEYRRTGEDVGANVKPSIETRDAIFELFRGAY